MHVQTSTSVFAPSKLQEYVENVQYASPTTHTQQHANAMTLVVSVTTVEKR